VWRLDVEGRSDIHAEAKRTFYKALGILNEWNDFSFSKNRFRDEWW
jgi:hypothetical protein